jgi:hypothetical protein
MSFQRSGTFGSGRLTGYGKLAPVRPAGGGPAFRKRSLRQWALARDSVLRHMD